MTVRNFDALFKPASVALVGASIKPASVGLITAQNLLRGGFSGPIWFVNPKYTSVADHACYCYPSIASLSSALDLAVLVTPPQTVPGLVRELGDRGTRAAVVITAGIRDDLKEAMLTASQPYTLRLQGPNCVGLMLPHLGLNASFSAAPAAGDIAFLSQSGALITGIVDWARARNIGFSNVVSLGDMADVDFGDLLDHLADVRKDLGFPAWETARSGGRSATRKVPPAGREHPSGARPSGALVRGRARWRG